MSVTLQGIKLPPSGRDFEVYTAVRVQERTTRDVAAEFGISQTRVCQLVERVALFLLEAIPEGTEADHAKRVQLAEQIAALRLQHMYGTAVRDYESSKGKPVIREIDAEGRPRTTITTTKLDVGDVKLLDRAVKFALVGAKLPAPTLSQHVVWEEEESRVAGGEARDAGGDYSKREVEQPVTATVLTQGTDASGDGGSDCVRAMMDVLQRNDGAARPVQTVTPAPAGGLDLQRRAARKVFLSAAG